jgi:hypothetical protein
MRPDGVALCLSNLARLMQDTGRLKEAEAMYRRALKILEESLGPGHSLTITTRENLERLAMEDKQKTVNGR